MRLVFQHRTCTLLLGLLLTACATTVPTPSPLPSAAPSVAPSPERSSIQPFSPQLHDHLLGLAGADRFAGVVLITQDGKPIFQQAYGLADHDNHVPNQLDTKFNLGSMNKMFTAVAIGQLAEQGKLAFSDRIGTYLPNYPQPAATKVTIHQLLTHTSGIGDYLMTKKFAAARETLVTVESYLPLFMHEPLAFEPGTQFHYSNGGYIVLGAIIEQVSGQNYYDYVRDHIYLPARMQNTGFYDPAGTIPNLAIGYTTLDPTTSQPGVLRDNTPFREIKGGPAGGGYSTVEDLHTFAIALLAHQLLSEATTEVITTGKVDSSYGKYGYGFISSAVGNHRCVGHGGNGPGMVAELEICPDAGYTIVVLSNSDPQIVQEDILPAIRAAVSAL
jgi:CubicO group peptidase (beta-lactamase class C family)